MTFKSHIDDSFYYHAKSEPLQSLPLGYPSHMIVITYHNSGCIWGAVTRTALPGPRSESYTSRQEEDTYMKDDRDPILLGIAAGPFVFVQI